MYNKSNPGLIASNRDIANLNKVLLQKPNQNAPKSTNSVSAFEPKEREFELDRGGGHIETIANASGNPLPFVRCSCWRWGEGRVRGRPSSKCPQVPLRLHDRMGGLREPQLLRLPLDSHCLDSISKLGFASTILIDGKFSPRITAKQFHPIAQGCAARATLGNGSHAKVQRAQRAPKRSLLKSTQLKQNGQPQEREQSARLRSRTISPDPTHSSKIA